MTALRHHRRPGPGVSNALTVISLLLVVTPWTFPSALGLALGLGAHVLWFSACERLAATRREPDRGEARRLWRAGGQSRAEADRSGPRPPAFVQVPVLAVIEEAPDIRTFRFARPEGFSLSRVSSCHPGPRGRPRCRPLLLDFSSSPAAQGYLDISVKRQGLVSDALHAIAASRRAARRQAPGRRVRLPGRRRPSPAPDRRRHRDHAAASACCGTPSTRSPPGRSRCSTRPVTEAGSRSVKRCRMLVAPTPSGAGVISRSPAAAWRTGSLRRPDRRDARARQRCRTCPKPSR